MTVCEQIEEYLAAQPPLKQADMRELHDIILGIMPGCRLWFLDGKVENGRAVYNPNIGYGEQALTYADGSTRDFYQIGISANTTGVSVYLIGLKDKNYLAEKYGQTIGQASVTGYCIKFRKLEKVDVPTLVDALKYGILQTGA